jgi:hypothetical protein
LGYNIEKNEMGWTFGTYGNQENCIIVFWWGDLTQGDHLEDLDVNGRIILKWILKRWAGVMDWICLARNSDWWRAFVNAVMNIRVK